MWVILVYDVGARRNSKVLKICRKYLIHIQKSVFEGCLSDRQYLVLQKELQKVIKPERDQVVVYTFHRTQYINKDVIGYQVNNDHII